MNVGFNNEIKERQEKLKTLKDKFLKVYKIHQDLEKESIVLYNRYYYVFGEIFYKRYELFCLCERARRKIELYYTYINKEEDIDNEKVEATLEKEFTEYEQKLNNILDEYNHANEYFKLPNLTDEEGKEIKVIYLRLVKAIHPDLNNDFSEEIKVIWGKVQNAYLRNDLESLKECEILLENVNNISIQEYTEIDLINSEIQKYYEKVDEYRAKIENIKNSFPYDKKELLDDEEQILEKKAQVEDDIEFFKDRLAKMEQRIIELNPSYSKIIC